MRPTAARLGVVVVLSGCLLLGLLAPAGARGGAVDCTQVGEYDEEFDNWFIDAQTFDGDVIVPSLSPDEGAFCVFASPVIKGNLIIERAGRAQGDLGPVALIFDGTDDGRVDGNVHVGRGADLRNYGATITGNVTCLGCDRVELAGGLDFDGNPFTTTIGGNVIVHRAKFGAAVTEAVVNGGVSITRSTANLDPDNEVFDTVEVSNSTVHGNVHIARNTGNQGSIRVADNTLDRNLICRHNDPAPTLGGGNSVGRQTLGQCR